MFVTRSLIRIKHCTVVLVNNFIFNHVPFVHPVLLYLCGFIAWFCVVGISASYICFPSFKSSLNVIILAIFGKKGEFWNVCNFSRYHFLCYVLNS
jgi:hypothetical protein